MISASDRLQAFNPDSVRPSELALVAAVSVGEE
jgi:hypothetical protein